MSDTATAEHERRKLDYAAEYDRVLPEMAYCDLRWGLFYSEGKGSKLGVDESEFGLMRSRFFEKCVEKGSARDYRHMCEKLGEKVNENECDKMAAEVTKRVGVVEAEIPHCKANYGELELRACYLRIGHIHCEANEEDKAETAYCMAAKHGIGVGTRMDIWMTLVRLSIVNANLKKARKYLDKATEELEKGGDWERRNKLAVYEAILGLSNRQWFNAGKRLLEGVTTFVATEFITFERFLFYTVMLCMLTADRATVKSKLLDNPEMITVGKSDGALYGFLESFYKCDYRRFFGYLPAIADRIKKDQFLQPHFLYFIRQARLNAYKQYLTPFRAVTIENMSQAFGLPPHAVEREVALFICNQNLPWRIDKTKNLIVQQFTDKRSRMYADILQQGDVLINRMQKLSRVINA